MLASDKHFTMVLFRSIVGSVLGMFYFGYSTGVVNAPEKSIKKFINESHKSHYWIDLMEDKINLIFAFIVSMFIVGGMLGAMIGGLVADKMGRRR